MSASKPQRVLSLILTLGFLLLPLSAAQAAPGDTTRVSVSSGGAQGNGTSGSASISADGRYVAFSSAANNLVSGDTNGMFDVFVHDRTTGATSRVSVASNGAQGNDRSGTPSISADGRYVAFYSAATNLVSGDTNGARDIFVHDRVAGTTSRVSVASNGTQGNDWSYAPSLSADGSYLAFGSIATNLVSGDTNAWGDIFIHDMQTGETSRISVAANGTQGNEESGLPSISADGRYVAFESAASNLVSGDTNSRGDVFVYDRVSRVTSRVSLASGGAQGNGTSEYPSISADGRYVAFDSLASNLVSVDTNDSPDVFVHDRVAGTTSRVSVATGGAQGNNGFESQSMSLSADGRYVALYSDATNLVSGDTNGWGDIFVHDRVSGQTSRVSVASDGAQGDGPSHRPSISADGRYVAFTSYTSNLVSGDTNGASDVFVHEHGITSSLRTFQSAAVPDGWVLESTETSSVGGTLNAAAATFILGDDAADRQYRTILSFNTAGLPDTAVITKATLKIKRFALAGTDPFTTHMGLKVDIRKPFFGTTAGLVISDFQAGAGLNNAATFSKTPATGAWYSAILSSTAFPYINRTGTTQFRLRFLKDDNDDMGADYLRFYSGNTLTASYRPVLVVQYYLP